MSSGTMNLSVPRSDRNVWDEPGWAAAMASCDSERWLAGGGGSALALVGVRRGGLGGALLATAGAALAVRAAMGRHDLTAARGWLTRTWRERGNGRREDIVDEANEESFPASDSPSFTSSRGGRLKG